MKALVVGDSCIDTYVYGSCDRLCPEGPVPILKGSERVSTLGMAGNTYNNLRAFCEEVDFVSNYPQQIVKTRFVDQKTNQLLLRVDIKDTCDRIEPVKREIEKAYDLVVVSDYCKGFLTDEDLCEIGCSCDLSVIDTKRMLTQDIVDCYSFIKLNRDEYEKNAELLESGSNMSKVIVTLGHKGVRFLDRLYPPPKVLQTFDVSGAGDVFTASFSAMLMGGHDPEYCINFAQQCCHKVIQRKGTCVYKKDMD
jgi:bifunctional ADP-heptose synthase (sugar kinase/adenylyltransferase)